MTSGNEHLVTVRLQIPVSKALADEMERLALKNERSVSRLGQRMIEASLNWKRDLGEWMRRRVIGPGTEKRTMGWRQSNSSTEERLQITITKDTADKLEQLADRLNHTPVRMAALLLDFAIDRFGLSIRLWSVWPLNEAIKMIRNPDEEKLLEGIQQQADVDEVWEF